MQRFKIPTNLSSFWQRYFIKTDRAVKENFWGNLSLLKKQFLQRDAYALLLHQMGHVFTDHKESPARFQDMVQWTLKSLCKMAKSKQVKKVDMIVPAKAFQLSKGSSEIVFVTIGQHVPRRAKEINLLSPDVFVKMIANGYFPIGQWIRLHTNQSLCEHDLCHITGFISCPEYMIAVRRAFRKIQAKMHQPKIAKALSNFNSAYSLRLYYMIEIFCIVPRKNLQTLLQLDMNQFSLDDAPELIYPIVKTYLSSKNPIELNYYLFQVYENINDIINPLGGESRDILNRIRKFNRFAESNRVQHRWPRLEVGQQRLGSKRVAIAGSRNPNPNSGSQESLNSKFNGSSLYSMILTGKKMLENKRSNHLDYQETIDLVHAPVISALIGTSQLTINDWVSQSIQEKPDSNSRMFKYITRTKLWNESHLLFQAYSCEDLTKILK